MATQSDDDLSPARRSAVICPKCKSAMVKVQFQNIEVDRCTSCKGIWLDMLEREHLDELAGSDAIDIGPAKPQEASAPRHLACPVCHTPMIRMVDLNKPAVHYDSCTVCYGVFYDAGEFKEHQEHHVLGFFKEWFRRKDANKPRT